jgi:hypothetical protein
VHAPPPLLPLLLLLLLQVASYLKLARIHNMIPSM